ncbi:MAG: ATP-binding protein [Clostridiales bacterium]
MPSFIGKTKEQLLNEIDELKKQVDELKTIVQISITPKDNSLDYNTSDISEEEVKKDYYFQKAINSILKLSMMDIPDRELLQSALSVILRVPGLSFGQSGCIFLKAEDSDSLELKASINLDKKTSQNCSLVPFGKCHCGLAAMKRKAQFSNTIDHIHANNSFESFPHGHYCVPMLSDNEQALGVINIFIDEGHIKDEKEIKFLSVIADYLSQIISHRQTEESFKELSSAVEQAADHIIITDRDGKIEYVNKAFEDVTGYTKEDWRNQTPRILKSGQHDDTSYKKMWQKILSGSSFRGVTINRKKNGELYYEEKTITPLKDKEGKITHFVSTGRDITERIYVEEKLRKAKEIAERSEKLKSDFLAQMSHEIRTPINSILNFTSLLKFELEDKVPPELKESFKYIDNGGRRLIRTIDMILNMSQIQSGSFDINTVQIDLSNEILEDVIMELRPMAKEKNLDLIFHKKTEPAKIMGDSYTIGQIFANLIDNAIKFTFNGRVEVVLGNNDEDDEIFVEVSDTGIGISENYLPHLFDPFSQEETGYTRRFEGNGLGLALVKKYVELNNAYIYVNTKKGRDSKFTVVFKKVKD